MGMHDEAIEERTRLRLSSENEEQEQARAIKDRNEEAESKQHKLTMERLQQEQRMALDTATAQSKLADQTAQLREFERHYSELAELGVDLTKHLAQKADRVIRLEAGDNVGGMPP